MKKLMSIGISALLVFVVLVMWQPVKIFFEQDSCLDNGGKWASIGNYCISRECAKNKSCLPSYNNYKICKRLKVGISQNELYFQLGMPESSDNNMRTFTGGGDASNIKAIVQNYKVVSLKCEI